MLDIGRDRDFATDRELVFSQDDIGTAVAGGVFDHRPKAALLAEA